ncbi:protein kinase [Pendulispora rubella]|uniref:Protein kinase n=1 Tax=Pendulispora rubella TaxID=2741070 RepID=A0ABZ2LCM3_9BACT
MLVTGVVANELPVAAGKYRPILELGRGGMAVVYLAVVRGPAGFNKLQVIKQLRPELAGEPDQVAMFLNEARVSARINHPNVVQINEIGREGDAYFMAMEYVDGQTLERIFRAAKGDIPLRLHLKVIAEALAGLHTAHELNDFNGTPLEIVHRDVSPHNILVGYEGEVKVVDFGIAKVAGSRSETRTGVLKGKFTYMAPEQFLGQKIDRRTDVFAAGVMLWQAVTKRRLWGREVNEIEVYRRVVESRIPRPREVNAAVPAVLDDMVMKALATDPAARHQSADELRAAIEDYLAAEHAHATPRELGALVSTHFTEERRAIRAAIEERMRGAALSRDGVPSVPLLQSLLPASIRDERLSSSIITGHSQSLSEAPFLGSHLAERAPWYRSPRVIGVVALAAAAGALVLWRPWNRLGTAKVVDAVAAAPSPSSAPAPSSSSAAPASTLTELTVHAAPPGAKIFVDGIEVEENPFVGKFVRDGASHRVRAEASGFASKSVRVEFSSETASLDLALERQSSAPRRDKGERAAPQTAAVAQPAPPANTPPAAPSGAAKPAGSDDPWAKRKKPAFDSSDPWK